MVPTYFLFSFSRSIIKSAYTKKSQLIDYIKTLLCNYYNSLFKYHQRIIYNMYIHSVKMPFSVYFRSYIITSGSDANTLWNIRCHWLSVTLHRNQLTVALSTNPHSINAALHRITAHYTQFIPPRRSTRKIITFSCRSTNPQFYTAIVIHKQW